MNSTTYTSADARLANDALNAVMVDGAALTYKLLEKIESEVHAAASLGCPGLAVQLELPFALVEPSPLIETLERDDPADEAALKAYSASLLRQVVAAFVLSNGWQFHLNVDWGLEGPLVVEVTGALNQEIGDDYQHFWLSRRSKI